MTPRLYDFFAVRRDREANIEVRPTGRSRDAMLFLFIITYPSTAAERCRSAANCSTSHRRRPLTHCGAAAHARVCSGKEQLARSLALRPLRCVSVSLALTCAPCCIENRPVVRTTYYVRVVNSRINLPA